MNDGDENSKSLVRITRVGSPPTTGIKKDLQFLGWRSFSAKRNVQEEFFMVKHIILWQLKDELSDAEKETVKAGIKEGLEGLIGKVPGLLEVHVHTNGLPTSNADVMLDTTLESFEALKGYAVHPAHVAVASTKVRPYFKTRTCMDFEV